MAQTEPTDKDASDSKATTDCEDEFTKAVDTLVTQIVDGLDEDLVDKHNGSALATACLRIAAFCGANRHVSATTLIAAFCNEIERAYRDASLRQLRELSDAMNAALLASIPTDKIPKV